MIVQLCSLADDPESKLLVVALIGYLAMPFDLVPDLRAPGPRAMNSYSRTSYY